MQAGQTKEAIDAFEKLTREFPQTWIDRAARERLAKLRPGDKKSADPPKDGKTKSRPEFAPRKLAKAFPPIVNAPTLPADKAGDRVSDNELVVGVVVGGEARAYPINMLTGPSREIINDTLGKHAIAATW